VSIEETLAGKLESRFEVVSAYADDWPNIVVGGVPQFAYWNDHVYALKGEAVTVAREVDPSGIARNTVIGRIGRPGADTGTVLTVESNYLLVSVGAVEVRARFDPDKTYTPGDIVALDWKGSTITALFVVTDYVPPAVDIPATTAPPPANNTGELPAFATDSATWSVNLGAWNVYATKNQNVYTGSWYGQTITAAWWYNGATKQLDGAAITHVRFRVPKRFAGVGASNDPGTLHIYVHTNDTRPGGDVSRVTGPYDFVIPPYFQGGFVDLPLAAGDQLKNGGGISIAGDPYMGFQGKAEDPASGQLLVGWSR
jgi:hypothetical protein